MWTWRKYSCCYSENTWNFEAPQELGGFSFNMKDAQLWDNDQIKAFQALQLQKILDYTSAHVPFYSSLKGFGYSSFPHLDKTAIIGKESEFYSTQSTKYSYNTCTTSGSTGQPFTYRSNIHDASWLGTRSFHMFVVEECGVKIFDNDKILEFSLKDGEITHLKVNAHSPNQVIEEGSNWKCMPVIKYGCDLQTLFEDAVELLRRDSAIKGIVGTPSLIHAFITYCEKAYKPFKKLCYITAGEFVYPEFRDQFKSLELFHRDFFAAPDSGAIFFECSHGKYHQNFLKSYCETIRRDGEHLLVSTSLFNISQPFIKYMNEDIVGELKWLEKRCACGRAGIYCDGIFGRFSDRLVASNGTKIPPMILFSLFSGYQDLGRWRVVQRKNGSIEIYIDNPNANSLNGIIDNLSKYFYNQSIIVKAYGDCLFVTKKNRFLMRES